MKKLAYILFSLLTFLNCNNASPEEDIITTLPNNSYSTIAIEILEEINLYRSSINLTSLEMNKTIYDEAKKHTEYMIEQGVISHDNFSDRTSRLLKNPGGSAIAENVAVGYSTAKAVVNSWLSSTGHKKNIEGNYNITGIAAIQDKNGKYYFTQIFLQKL